MADSGELKEDVEVGGLELKTDAELAVSPSITLDNGLTVAGSLQWELTGTDNADDTTVAISGPGLGRVLIGQTSGAGIKMTVGAPGIANAGWQEWFPSAGDLKPRTDGMPYVFGNLGGTANDAADYQAGEYRAARLAYFTPAFNGLTFGISYAPDGATSNKANNVHRNANEVELATNIIDMGVGFSQAFGDANVSFSAAYGMANVEARRAKVTPTDASDRSGSLNNWSVGGSVTFGAITVGGTIAENNSLGDYENLSLGNDGEIGGNDADADMLDGDTDHSGMNFGVTYNAPGPWSFGAKMSTGTSAWKAAEAVTGTGSGGAGNDRIVEKEVDRTAFTVGAAQSLGSGVTWSIWYNSVEKGAASASAFGTSLGISF